MKISKWKTIAHKDKVSIYTTRFHGEKVGPLNLKVTWFWNLLLPKNSAFRIILNEIQYPAKKCLNIPFHQRWESHHPLSVPPPQKKTNSMEARMDSLCSIVHHWKAVESFEELSLSTSFPLPYMLATRDHTCKVFSLSFLLIVNSWAEVAFVGKIIPFVNSTKETWEVVLIRNFFPFQHQ